jgi:multidrug efflux pump subunit AcrB
MTLSGLSLAIGILVDESTVTIENIHQHMDMGKPKSLAIWDACKEIAFPKLLILFCILAVFAPAFTMKGIPGALFLPLALAIAFSMITSYFLAQTFVPILANWMMKGHKGKKGEKAMTDEEEFVAAHLPSGGEQDAWGQKEILLERASQHKDVKMSRFDKFRDRFMRFLERTFPYRKPVVIGYVLLISGAAFLLLQNIGRDVLPKVNAGQFQVRMRGPEGTRVEKTEQEVLKALTVLNQLVGKENISITSAFAGQHPGLFSGNPIYLFMPGPQDAVLQVQLKDDYKTNMEELQERFRQKIKEEMPEVRVSFEPIQLTDKILSQGSPTPIEVRVSGKNKKLNEEYANKVIDKLNKISYLRDIQIGQSVNYPALNINVDRIKAAQMGVDVGDISRSLVASTSSSRYTEKNIWIDTKIGLAYAVQVQVPENKMTSIDEVREIPVLRNAAHPVLGDVATITTDSTYGEDDNVGVIPMLSVTANLYKTDLGSATKDVQAAIQSMGTLPRGLTIETKGLSQVLTDTLDSLQSGLLVAIIVIFLMLAANFQSFKVSLVVLVTVPAVILGSLALLMITGSTLNLQSYMGMIMSVGVSISNSVMLITNAEQLRKHNGNALLSAKEAASLRIRPILMTSVAMVVGMIPMAAGIGEGGDQASPLGRAVIGGLVASTFAALLILPLVFAWVMGNTSTDSVSLDPEDKESKHYIPSLYEKNEK